MSVKIDTSALFVPAAVLLDMDGLMLDTERPAVRCWVDVAREHGFELDENVPLTAIGLDERATRAHVLSACGPCFPYDELRVRVEKRYHEFLEENGPAHRPGLLQFLDSLSRLGIPFAVATSATREAAKVKLLRAGLLDRFDAVACGDEVDRLKPAPDVYLLAAHRLAVSPRDCVGFEDSPAGLRALEAAGIRSVFVKDCVEPPPEVLKTVWRRCGTLSEAARLFG